jgi:hypothetical protein
MPLPLSMNRASNDAKRSGCVRNPVLLNPRSYRHDRSFSWNVCLPKRPRLVSIALLFDTQ